MFRCKNSLAVVVLAFLTLHTIVFVSIITWPTLTILYGNLFLQSTESATLNKSVLTLTKGTKSTTKNNAERVPIAQSYLNAYGNLEWSRRDVPANLSICVITRRRPYAKNEYEYYLTQTVGYLLNELAGNKLRYNVALCNVDEEPKKFEEAWKISNFYSIPMMITLQNLSISSKAKNKFETEKIDYYKCMSMIKGRFPNSRFYLLLEDDALPVESYFGKNLHILLDGLITPFSSRPVDVPADRNLLFVKLYHPSTLQKFPWLPQRIAVTLMIMWILFEICMKFMRVKTTNFILGILVIAVVFGKFVFNLLRISNDKYWYRWIRNLFTRNSVYLVPNESCCTPAVLFSNFTVEFVADYLASKYAYDGYAKDYLLDEMAWQYAKSYSAYLTEFNFIKHIGKFTTLRNKPVLLMDY